MVARALSTGLIPGSSVIRAKKRGSRPRRNEYINGKARRPVYSRPLHSLHWEQGSGIELETLPGQKSVDTLRADMQLPFNTLSAS